MTITIGAIYEQGVLRLAQPIPLAEGTQVEVIVISTNVSENTSPSEILAKIAALPLEGESGEFSGQAHDRILYHPKINKHFYGVMRCVRNVTLTPSVVCSSTSRGVGFAF